jgi:anti-sigma B factor antagonist
MVGPEFSIRSGELGQWILVSAVGELDLATSPRLRAALDDAAARSSRVVIDLSEVTFLDSSALSVLVRSHTLLTDAGGELKLVVQTPSVRKVLEVTGLTDVFSVHDSLAAVGP